MAAVPGDIDCAFLCAARHGRSIFLAARGRSGRLSAGVAAGAQNRHAAALGLAGAAAAWPGDTAWLLLVALLRAYAGGGARRGLGVVAGREPGYGRRARF